MLVNCFWYCGCFLAFSAVSSCVTVALTTVRLWEAGRGTMLEVAHKTRTFDRNKGMDACFVPVRVTNTPAGRQAAACAAVQRPAGSGEERERAAGNEVDCSHPSGKGKMTDACVVACICRLCLCTRAYELLFTADHHTSEVTTAHALPRFLPRRRVLPAADGCVSCCVATGTLLS